MTPVFIQVIKASDSIPCLVNVNHIHTVTTTVGGGCQLFISQHAQPLETLMDYNAIVSLIEQATSRLVAK